MTTTMKSRVFFLLPGCLLLWFMVPLAGLAQTVDCEGTLASWRMTHPDYAKHCRCARSNQLPVCTEPGTSSSRGSSSPGKGNQTQQDFKKEITGTIMRNLIQNALSPQNTGPSQEELLRKQQEEELARKKKEQEELERQRIFDRNKQELLQTMKGTNSSSGLKLKGGGEEVLELKSASDTRRVAPANKNPEKTAH